MAKCDKNGSLITLEKYHYPLEKNGTFSNREMQILHLLHLGLSSKEIGANLSISEFTVFKHRRNMIEKAGVTNTHALINYAGKMGSSEKQIWPRKPPPWPAFDELCAFFVTLPF